MLFALHRSSGDSTSHSSRRPRWLTVLFSLIPLCVLLTLLEVVLRLAGMGDIGKQNLVGVDSVFPMHAYIWPRDRTLGPWFRVGEDGVVRTNQVLTQRSMYQLSFPLEKGEGELRLFALGGSTTQGGYSGAWDGGFPENLEKVLRRLAPQHAWRVLNAGVGGMDSNAFPALVREVLDLNPDGLIVYAGNNELRGRLTQVCAGPYFDELQSWSRRLVIVRVARALLQRLRGVRPVDVRQALVDQDTCWRRAVLEQNDEQAGEGSGGAGERVHGDEPWLPEWPARTDEIYLDTVRQFEENLEEVFDMARDRDVQVWLAVPPVNYLIPPTFPLFRSDLSPRRQHDLAVDLKRATQLTRTGHPRRAVPILDVVLEKDPTHAGACFARGRLALDEGDLSQARTLLQRAIDRDFVGSRLTSHMQAMLRGLCRGRAELRCVDVQSAFEAEADGSLPGPGLFVDFCHPTIEKGVGIIAEELADAVLEWASEVPYPVDR